jgi:hypothetical protein
VIGCALDFSGSGGVVEHAVSAPTKEIVIRQRVKRTRRSSFNRIVASSFFRCIQVHRVVASVIDLPTEWHGHGHKPETVTIPDAAILPPTNALGDLPLIR